MKITYIYHSGFAIETNSSVIIIDYYKDPSGQSGAGIFRKLAEQKTNKFYVLSSHAHADHFNVEILSWQASRPDMQYIFSKDIQKTGKAEAKGIVFLDKGDTFKDEHISIRAFGSTDEGISFLLETEGKRIFHAGDLNNWHWEEESTPEESRQYEAHFLKELEVLAEYSPSVDVAMFPVDPRLGKNYMLGAQQFIDRIRTSVFIPMHFWEKYDKANAFGAYAAEKSCRFITLHQPGDSIEL